jgi:hypothetical protein
MLPHQFHGYNEKKNSKQKREKREKDKVYATWCLERHYVEILVGRKSLNFRVFRKTTQYFGKSHSIILKTKLFFYIEKYLTMLKN